MPKNSAGDVDQLKALVDEAFKELHEAMQFHEAWRPTRTDSGLHERMSFCSAGNTFLAIRFALRRELLLSLARLWDNTKGTLRLSEIGRLLRNEQVIDALADERHKPSSIFPLDVLRSSIAHEARQALSIIDKYDGRRSPEAVSEKIRRLRNNVLAHRSTSYEHVPDDSPGDNEVEDLYQNMASLIAHLLHVTQATAYNPREYADQLKTCAHHFWAGVKGERTEGHPHYRAPPAPLIPSSSG